MTPNGSDSFSGGKNRFGLEVLSLKIKWYHRDQRVALSRLHASDPKSGDLPKKKEKQAPRRITG